MKKAFLFVLGMMLLTVGFTGCKYSKPLDGPGMELDSADVAALDSMNVSELTYANMAGIYDDEGQGSRISLNTDGTASWCMIGSLNMFEL